MQAYSDPGRETDPHALPDIEVFQMTAEEVAVSGQYEEEIYDLMQARFPIAGFNSRDRSAMIDALIEQEGISGGWYWQACFPGCLPDGEPTGPFETREAALEDAQSF